MSNVTLVMIELRKAQKEIGRIEGLERMIDRLEMLRDTMEMRIEELEAQLAERQTKIDGQEEYVCELEARDEGYCDLEMRFELLKERNAKLERVREAALVWRTGRGGKTALLEALAACEDKDSE